MNRVRRAVILPVVLLVLVLLGLLGAMFAFRVNADLSSTQVIAYRLQTRLAAEAGIDRVKLLLREARFDMDRWYHNPEELHRIVVWAEDYDPTTLGTNDEFDEGTMAYRFSIVADDPTDDEDFIRVGITDEASKVNLNEATGSQLLILVAAAVGEGGDEEEVDPQEIVDAILDWRDKNSIPRGEAGDTEGDYYRKLPKPYLVKNGPFDTVEELLLVKGVTGQVLFGEDFDRNGLLTPNEDDGDDSFPPDNEDGQLNRGLYPYLTTFSKETNVSNDNRQRVYLYGDSEVLRSELTLAFPENPEVVDFVVSATQSSSGQGGPSAGNGGDGSGDPKGGGPGSTGNPEGGGEGSEGGSEGSLDDPDDGGEPSSTNPTGDSETVGGAGDPGPMRSAASLLRDQGAGEQTQRSPVTLEHLPVLLDRTTVVDSKQKAIDGLININTAPPLVLRCVEGLSEEQIESIVEKRERLTPEEKATTAWLLVEEVVDLDTFERIAPLITARAQQFTIEALGFADHVGMITRLQVIVDMVGPIAQNLYYRDLTYLAGHYPIREEDLERIRAH